MRADRWAHNVQVILGLEMQKFAWRPKHCHWVTIEFARQFFVAGLAHLPKLQMLFILQQHKVVTRVHNWFLHEYANVFWMYSQLRCNKFLETYLRHWVVFSECICWLFLDAFEYDFGINTGRYKHVSIGNKQRSNIVTVLTKHAWFHPGLVVLRLLHSYVIKLHNWRVNTAAIQPLLILIDF